MRSGKPFRHDYHRQPWFLLLVAFAIWGCGYITADDNRIERENKFSCNWTKAETTDEPVKLASLQEAQK